MPARWPERDQMYAAFAANAYPKLVEALRLCGERFAVIQKDVAPFERNVDYIKKIASEFADEARALLRSLGEE
jgi:hypothetical protein